MAEMILPGVYIDVRAEGLIAAGQVTVGNIGMVGTARRGPVGRAVLLSTYAEAVEMFGAYDEWDPAGTPLTLVRALELAYANGATTVYAVRVEASGAKAKTATFALVAGATTVATLQAPTPGSWGNDVEVNVLIADANAVVTEVLTDPAALKLAHNPAATVTPKIRVFRKLAGQTQVPAVSFGAAAPGEGGKVAVEANGTLHFFPGSAAPAAPSEVPVAGDVVTVTYEVDAGSARKVSLRLGGLAESYIVADGKHLASLLGGPLDPAGSPLARADKATATTGLPDIFTGLADWRKMGTGTNTAGSDGAATSDNDYKDGLELLTNEEVHIVVAAGQGTAIADRLLAHVQSASSDKVHRDRVAVLGSNRDATPAQIAQHNVASDRLVFVGPGIRTSDAASTKSDKSVVLPGAYAAAAVAGMMSARDPHVSLTNKVVAVAGVAGGAGHGTKPTPAELELMVQNRVLALEERQGVRVVKAITTDDGAFKQVTTRRIVDYAKFGVRSASQPFIGLLNNDRVRKALQGSINGFLAGMVDDEMLVSYDLAVTATRDEEIRGIARVTMTVKPTFSIDYIKVTMFLG